MVVVRGYWRVGVGENEEQIEMRKFHNDSDAAAYRSQLNARGCPIVSVTYER